MAADFADTIIARLLVRRSIRGEQRTRALHSKRELGLNPKPRHFKPFEYFDHTGFELFEQVEDGRMAYIGSVIDDTTKLLNREPLLLRDWAKLHANELLEAAGS
jgi:hypothetical protein